MFCLVSAASYAKLWHRLFPFILATAPSTCSLLPFVHELLKLKNKWRLSLRIYSIKLLFLKSLKWIITSWNLEPIEGRIIFSKPHTQDALTWKDQTMACKRVHWDLFAHYALWKIFILPIHWGKSLKRPLEYFEYWRKYWR